MRRVQAGAPECFAVLADRYFDVLVRVAESRLATREAAEEIAQEALFAAFKSRHTYNPSFGFRTWLWTILLNACRREHKRGRRSPQVLAWTDVHSSQQQSKPNAENEVSPREDQPVARALAREASARLNEHLRELRTEEADALRLRFYAALTFQEIADATGCCLSTAKNRVRTGLTKLAEQMREEESQEESTERSSRMLHKVVGSADSQRSDKNQDDA